MEARYSFNGKESCINSTCEEVMGLFEKFFSTLPEEKQAEVIEARFRKYRESYPHQEFACMSKICLPLLQLISKSNSSHSEQTDLDA